MLFNHDLTVNILNSTFINNKSDHNGGAICIDNISNLDLNIISNTFIKNEGINGGAIYLYDNNKSLSKKNGDKQYFDYTININDNTFKENLAHNYGGAIFYKLYTPISSSSSLIKNKYENNKAGILGGAIYTDNSKEQNIPDIDQNTFSNNFANDFDNNYTSKPSYILLNTILAKNKKIYSGDYLPLMFDLYDEYGKIMEVNNYINNIIMKVTMEKKNEHNNNSNNNNNDNNKSKVKTHYLTGNVASFISGKCNLNSLQIYANPDQYILRFSIENYNEFITLNTTNTEIEVMECDNKKIKKYDTFHNITYCEEPTCLDSCPIKKSAECLPNPNDNTINDPTKNICHCLEGFEGINCQDYIIVDYKYESLIINFNIIIY
ncbi:hypothetical protein PIROE2DRAFT_10249 [Piromyces sp. E2]|nr:hypothetical protein PIROE2DRAFT_10249 [Piromyces sp. E2]|eukprot:OUM63281.1 hypothetical protein PIROE2DRAFT_10249 [Piromyces sp. E2]